jgi:peptidyl-prolyl cis-trans isomerase-like 4
MSVLIETSLGDMVVDLFTQKAPKASFNFLKLCKRKFYNNALFISVQKDYITTVNGVHSETSIYESEYGEPSKYFADEINPSMLFNRFGLLATANLAPNKNLSNFFFTMTDRSLVHLD